AGPASVIPSGCAMSANRCGSDDSSCARIAANWGDASISSRGGANDRVLLCKTWLRTLLPTGRKEWPLLLWPRFACRRTQRFYLVEPESHRSRDYSATVPISE